MIWKIPVHYLVFLYNVYKRSPDCIYCLFIRTYVFNFIRSSWIRSRKTHAKASNIDLRLKHLLDGDILRTTSSAFYKFLNIKLVVEGTKKKKKRIWKCLFFFKLTVVFIIIINISKKNATGSVVFDLMKSAHLITSVSETKVLQPI